MMFLAMRVMMLGALDCTGFFLMSLQTPSTGNPIGDSLMAAFLILFGTGGAGYLTVKFVTARLDKRAAEDAEVRRMEREAQSRRDEQIRNDQQARYDELKATISRMDETRREGEALIRDQYERQIVAERANTERIMGMLNLERERNEAFVKAIWSTNPDAAAKARRQVVLDDHLPTTAPGTSGG